MKLFNVKSWKQNYLRLIKFYVRIYNINASKELKHFKFTPYFFTTLYKTIMLHKKALKHPSNKYVASDFKKQN